ncbi:hypothetical protein FSP39_025213 [Pinctada imbricata]|uniref:Dynactin subunit 6 n=1 Tax=Pinctada imbricata TaxID=66713 RepID=A0AA88YAU6_PINIB|nr:hypothetical protein FSP39_025213 [Pinctada imbricata]
MCSSMPPIIGQHALLDGANKVCIHFIHRHLKKSLHCGGQKRKISWNPDKSGGTQQVMIIGNNNIFEVGSYIESTKIGDHNVVEAKGYVGRHLEMTSGCIIGAKCEVKGQERLPENTVISGSDCVRRIAADRPPAQGLQIEFLMKILPNYHYIRRLKSGSSQRK